MKVERTLSIIKPNAVAKNVIGEIFNKFEVSGFKIIGIKMMRLNKKQTENFYHQHQDKFFFIDLILFMISGPIVVSVLERKNAVRYYRELMGATDPKKAIKGTLRAEYGDDYTANALHGSDSIKSAIFEIDYFFRSDELS
ncbi:nucleoside-diphosphate kinase [Candidatus Pantoea edessiphila]|uniref:Nucleoside diphosphate kinase n=1 Tax=Candidatus Pantoea edessiphila TaxID=2044610 RepID=A0A2P5SWG1_9GAMM|nr:nucleoside-diphosphate kinase [Candidatus Pantoea edessiphila]PPI86677.1 nucleoside-diphosphate kinase [Candidatus Pantoea edessiphila]